MGFTGTRRTPGRSISEWKTFPCDENFFRTGLVTLETLTPDPCWLADVGMGRMGWKALAGSWLSKLEVELWRLSLSLPCPEDEKPLGWSRVWKEETRARP